MIALLRLDAKCYGWTHSGSAEASRDPRMNQIPGEFQGRWVGSPDQCEAPDKGWLYVSSFRLEFREGFATVVSVSRINPLEIEVDLTLRDRSKEGKDWRQIRRFILSPDRRTMTDELDRNRVVRVRCD